MAPTVKPIQSDATLPPRVDVVIIGGGAIGACTALFLAQKGVSTLLCEKGRIAGEQSSRNWGWCRKMGRDPRELPLIIESMRLWGGMKGLLEEETGFRQCGIIQFCDTAAELAKCEAWLNHARQYQLDTRIVPSKAIESVIPRSGKGWVGAMYTPSDGRAEPTLATSAIVKGARRLGTTVMTSCAVRGIETRGGRVAGVVTEKGRVACGSVVLSGGAWSRLFCTNLNLDLPQLKVMTSVLRTVRLEGGPECSAIGPGFSFRKDLSGAYVISQANRNVVEVVPDSFLLLREFLPVVRARWKKLHLRISRLALHDWTVPRHWSLDQVSPFERNRVLDPEPYRPFVDEALRNASAAFPFFQNATVADTWAGIIDVTPDVVPVISAVDNLPGFFVSTGFSGHGFGIAPGAGKLMADLVTGGTPVVDPTSFKFSRYRDGSRPQPSALAV